jgi:hypothetical protein
MKWAFQASTKGCHSGECRLDKSRNPYICSERQSLNLWKRPALNQGIWLTFLDACSTTISVHTGLKQRKALYPAHSDIRDMVVPFSDTDGTEYAWDHIIKLITCPQNVRRSQLNVSLSICVAVTTMPINTRHRVVRWLPLLDNRGRGLVLDLQI